MILCSVSLRKRRPRNAKSTWGIVVCNLVCVWVRSGSIIGVRICHVRWWSRFRRRKTVTAELHLHAGERWFAGNSLTDYLTTSQCHERFLDVVGKVSVQISSSFVVDWLFADSVTHAAFDSTRYTFTTSISPAQCPCASCLSRPLISTTNLRRCLGLSLSLQCCSVQFLDITLLAVLPIH